MSFIFFIFIKHILWLCIDLFSTIFFSSNIQVQTLPNRHILKLVLLITYDIVQ